ERDGDECPFIPLPASWDTYLAGLSAKTRGEIRHDRRALEKLGNVTIDAVTDPARIDNAMAIFMRLHQARRGSLGDQGSFANDRYARFHALVSRRFAERHWLRVWILTINGDPVAARYQFAYAGRVHDYLPGHDPRWDKYSVWLVLLSHCVEQAILRGEREIDLLRGTEGYKSRWASQTRKQVTLTASRRFTRAWVRHAAGDTTRHLRQTAKHILPAAVQQMLRGKLKRFAPAGRRSMATQFVPFFPSTSPRDLLGPRWPHAKPFPLDEPRTQFYYFARNGIWHAIDLLGLTPNDEVLMPAYNNGMEVAPFQHRGIPLRYVHVDRQMTLDLKDLEEKITSRSRMIYVIHYLGFPQPIQEIRALCRERGLLLFEDCALAFGSSVNGRPLGSFGDVAIFCLAKFLPVPNGGVLVLNAPDLALPATPLPPSPYSVASQLTSKVLDHVQAHGGPWATRVRHLITRAGQRLVRQTGLRRVDSGVMEFLPDKVDWGMARVSHRILERLDYQTMYQRRRANYLALLERVNGIPGVIPLQLSLPDGVCPLFLPVLVEDNQRVCTAMIARKISAGGFWSWFPPAVPVEEFPDTVFLRKHVLELQVHQDLNTRHLEQTAEHLREVMRSFR
ncbi:MAG: GNAT family N-acetyltransferase, partial [Candidatus Methylomirabilis sp.]